MRIRRDNSTLNAFSVLEVLVATAALLLLIVLLVNVTAQTARVWKSSAGRVSSYQSARAAFDSIARNLSQATLNTYFDYVDKDGNYRDPHNPGAFVPVGFKRASELHFACGAARFFTGKSEAVNPGHAVFFHATLDRSESPALRSLPRLLNAVGYFVEYSPANTGGLPGWLTGVLSSRHQFQLRQVIQPTEENLVYTSPNGWDWIKPLADGSVRPGVLADNVPLFVIRMRLSPQDEAALAGNIDHRPYTPSLRGSVLCPDYVYNSRAWQSAPQPQAVPPGPANNRLEIMRNQIAPIADLAMVAVDPRSLARLDMKTSTPPAVLLPPPGSFSDSSLMEADLAAYEQQLSQSGILFRTFRTSVPILSSKWSNSF